MKKNLKIYSALALGLILVASAVPAKAMTAQEAKAQGLIKEDCNGYVVPLKQEGQNVATDINTKRKSKYAEIAQKTGATVQFVAEQTGKKLCGK